MTWTPDLVLTRLIDAYRIIEAVTKNPKPRAGGSAHPAMSLDPEDRYTGRHLDEIERQLKAERERRASVAAGSISAALEAQRWPLDIIANEDRRECLIRYASCRARDGDWSRTVDRRNRRAVNKKAWARRSTYRWNEQSLQRIAEKLNNDRVPLKDCERCAVTHEMPENQRETDTMVSHAWIAPDAMPRPIAEMDNPEIYVIPRPRKRKRRKA